MSSVALLRSCPQVNGCPIVTARDLRRLDIAPRFRTILIAAVVSGMVHLGAMAAMAPPSENALMAGGAENVPAALGTSFEDFAAGSPSPSAPTPVPPPPMPQAEPAPMADLAAELVAAPPEEALLPMPAPVESATLPDVLPPERAESQVPPTEQAEAQLPDRPDVTPPDVTQIEPVTAEPEHVEVATATTPAPPVRPDPTMPEPEPSRQASAPQGNAEQDARRGSQQTDQGQATSNAPAQQAAQVQGNAAVSNYPGEVLRVIQRTRQARSPSRGRALVVFSVGNRGELAAASIAQSSGHPGLDRVALDHIRRAAPFPPPPPGAQRQFSFEFIGR